jgi:LysM repeat protein
VGELKTFESMRSGAMDGFVHWSAARGRGVALAAFNVAFALIVAGCANEPSTQAPGKGPGGGGAGTPAASATPAPEPARPAPPPQPELSPAQAKAQAQKLALEAVDQLQVGDETAAKQTLGNALALDATNELARKMQEQVGADAQRELGATFFRYTVQRDDTLAKLAQQYLGDRFKFYILAKYNDIANPSRLGAGQVIKIPGRAPAPAVAAPTTPAPAPAAEAAKPADDTNSELAQLMKKGRDLQASGDLAGAYVAYSDAATRYPTNAAAVSQRNAAKAALIRAYDRDATQAFQRQNLDLAISKWDRLLELDPANQKAKLERDRAIDLKKRMSEKFGNNPPAK